MDTGYGHLVIRTGTGPTAGAIYDRVRDLMQQTSCTDDFIKKAASRNAKRKADQTTFEEGTDNEGEAANQEDSGQGEGEDAQIREGANSENEE